MKSSIKKDTFKAIYRLLVKVSPINGDCGLLCGSICCTCEDHNSDFPDDESNGDDAPSLGIYLLPGEEKLFSGDEAWLSWIWEYAEDYEFPESWHGKVYFLQCKNAPFCHRRLRPLQCRIFPLTPHLDDEGNLYMIYQSGQLPYSCPLISERIKLNDDFLKANFTVWKHLIKDPLIYDLVEMDSQYRLEDGDEIEILYPKL